MGQSGTEKRLVLAYVSFIIIVIIIVFLEVSIGGIKLTPIIFEHRTGNFKLYIFQETIKMIGRDLRLNRCEYETERKVQAGRKRQTDVIFVLGGTALKACLSVEQKYST